MNLLDDEILNRYLDGELSPEEKVRVENILNSSAPDKNRFTALQLIHRSLLNFEPDKAPSATTQRVMMRIKKKRARARQQSYFALTTISIFGIICLGIIAYLSAGIIASSNQSSSAQIIDKVYRAGDVLVTYLKKIFSGENLSIIGSVFSFAILIAGYYFYELQKRMKGNLRS